VREHDVAWTAGKTANARGIHVELVGRAFETNWLGEGWPVLERAAPLVRHVCERWGVARGWLDDKQVAAGLPGITSHANVTEAFGESTHVDPGGIDDKHFPAVEFIRMVWGDLIA
jgi:hypothetical protein